MKLFAFQPSSYGPQWFVAAESRDAAIAAVQAHIAKDDEGVREWMLDELREMIDGANGARIDEHEIGEVVQTEIC